MVAAPLIAIVGPTASGKTGLAVKLAQKFGGEIICADSRTIYREMNIGTAKPTREEMHGIPHFGLDLVDPNERFTVADFQKYAEQKIAEMREREKIPFLVGGSGLYIDSVIFNYKFGEKSDEAFREKLNQMSVDKLQNYCKINNILPENYKNKRYLIRAIECQAVVENAREKLRDNTVVIGIETDKEVLRGKIAKRIREMFDRGIEDETRELLKKYPLTIEAMKSNIYPIVARSLCGDISRDEAIKLAEIDDWHLARKQMTWFRRNPFIKWLPLDAAENLNTKFLLGV